MENSINKKAEVKLDRRQVLKTGLALAGGSLLASVNGAQKVRQEDGKATLTKQNAQNASSSTFPGRCKLGKLEVSSVGLGVRNMSRTYQTTIPSRTEMFNIIRTVEASAQA